MKYFTFTIIFLCLASYVFPNGGPIDVSHFYKTHNIKLLNKADIELKSEILSIKIEGKYSVVKVVYMLKNLGPTQRINYGFAVDFIEGYENIDNITDNYIIIDNQYNEYDFIKYFNFYDNDKKIIDTSSVIESKIDSIYLENSYYAGFNPVPIGRKWFIADLDFETNELKTLKVEYKISNYHQDILPGLSFVPQFTERIFTYFFSPSGMFGDGKVDNMSIIIDMSEVFSNGSKYEISGISPFIKKDNILIFNQSNFNLNGQKNLMIKYK